VFPDACSGFIQAFASFADAQKLARQRPVKPQCRGMPLLSKAVFILMGFFAAWFHAAECSS